MNPTRKFDGRLCDKLAVNNNELSALLGCGLHSAQRIGEEANARLMVGRRVLWSVAKIQKYLDEQTMDN